MRTHYIKFYDGDYAETICGLNNMGNFINEGCLDIELTDCKNCKKVFLSKKKKDERHTNNRNI